VTLDERVLRFARTRGHTPARDRAVARLSALGQHAACWLALGAAGTALAPPRRRPEWARATAAVALTYVLNSAVKLAIRRPRPRLEDLPPLTGTPTQLSFPSAHAATSVCAAWVYPPLGAPRALVLPLALALPLSRLYLGVHYPSDLLAGGALGAIVGGAAR
jgi:membrane-associated phospholipid phosphatase